MSKKGKATVSSPEIRYYKVGVPMQVITTICTVVLAIVATLALRTQQHNDHAVTHPKAPNLSSQQPGSMGATKPVTYPLVKPARSANREVYIVVDHVALDSQASAGQQEEQLSQPEQVARVARAPYESDLVTAFARVKTIRQSSEITSGPAALASLLVYYFQEPTSEDEIARSCGTYGKGTTSLLDLRNACLAKGYKAVGYKMTLGQLTRQIQRTGKPVLIYIARPTKHFALVVGQVGDLILMADPALGRIVMSSEDFADMWGGCALVVSHAP